MPITIEVKDKDATSKDFDEVFKYFKFVDETYSPFKEMSEVGKLNRGEKVSDEMELILSLAQDLKEKTNGYFDIKNPNGKIDPSGIVKGWAIAKASDILWKKGFKNFFVDAGGDAEIVGKNWKWGIRNPFNKSQIIKVLNLSDCGIATSGTYERGQHIYNPVDKKTEITDIVSLTVIGPDVYEADKFATPAFAMGRDGIRFIESQKTFEGYMIDKDGIATMTSGFKKFLI
jgi:thiamine biosynthesis lipoprotein